MQIRQRTFAGCTVLTDRDTRGLGVTIVLPHVYVAAVFAILPLVWIARIWRRERRRRRAIEAYCARCGYDLRASSNRCPECGTNIPAP